MRKAIRVLFILLTLIFTGSRPMSAKELVQDNNNGMIVRISEVEVYPEYLAEYLSFAKEVAQETIRKEKDVISMYPMAVMKDNTQIRILEIYKNQEAYEKHIVSSHFQKYKKGTLHMVKNLALVDTYQLCPENFDKIFKRVN